MENDKCMVGEMLYLLKSVSLLLDCPREGSGDPDCDCDGVDGS